MNSHLTKKIAEYLGVEKNEVKRVEKWNRVYFVVFASQRPTFVSQKAVIDYKEYAAQLTSNFSNAIRFKYVGVSDDVLECECCGKQNLKRTAVLQKQDTTIDGWENEEPDTENVYYFGSSCAVKLLAKGRDNKAYQRNKNRKFEVVQGSFEAEDCKITVKIVNNQITQAFAERKGTNQVLDLKNMGYKARWIFLKTRFENSLNISSNLKKQLQVSYF